MNIIFVDVELVLRIHSSRIEKYGGSHGVREENLLLSALEMPKQSFGEEFLHEFPFGMAGAYLFHIAKNHPFVDGNKRTALATMLVFLEMNGYEVGADGDEIEQLVLDVATGKMKKEGIAEVLEKWCRKK